MPDLVRIGMIVDDKWIRSLVVVVGFAARCATGFGGTIDIYPHSVLAKVAKSSEQDEGVFWKDVESLKSSPAEAKFVISKGLHGEGELLIDFGVVVPRGQVIIAGRQNGRRDAFAKAEAAGDDGDYFGIPQVVWPYDFVPRLTDFSEAIIKFDRPLRRLRIKVGSPAEAERQAVWEYRKIVLRCEETELPNQGGLRARVAQLQDELAVVEDRSTGRVKQQLSEIRNSLSLLEKCDSRPQPDDRHLEQTRKDLIRKVALASSWVWSSGSVADLRLGALWQSSMNKIRTLDDVTTKNLGNTGQIYLARHEFEALQLCLLTADRPLSNVSASFEWNGPSADHWPQVQLLLVQDVPVKGYSPWPDRLVPLNDQEFALDARDQLCLWVRVHADQQTPSASYSGTVNIVVGEKVVLRAPLQINVMGFTLPVTGHLRVSTGNGGWDPDDFATKRVMLESRIPVGGALGRGEVFDPPCTITKTAAADENPGKVIESITIDFGEYDRVVERMLEMGVNTMGIGYFGGYAHVFTADGMWKDFQDPTTGQTARLSLNPLDGPEASQRCAQWFKQFYLHVEEKGWADKYYLWFWDEPSDPGLQKKWTVPIMSEIRKMVPRLKNMSPCNGPITAMNPYIDIYCIGGGAMIFPNPGVPHSGIPDVVANAQDMEKEVWTYMAGDDYPVPTFTIPHSGMSARIFALMAWKYDLTGILFWSVGPWTQSHTEGPLNGLFGIHGKGNGELFYRPLVDGKPSGPLQPSIRSEIIRDGIEDYEYFWMLRDAIRRAEQSGTKAGVIETANDLLRVPGRLFTDIYHWSEKPADYEQHRLKIGLAIEELLADASQY